jgi:D-lactate dehydrogenase
MNNHIFKLAFFSTQKYDIKAFQAHCPHNLKITFFNEQLNPHTAVLAHGFDGVCSFVNDDLSEQTLIVLSKYKINFITLRCAGFNNVDMQTANKLKMVVTRVPSYSPEAVAEHTLALMLTLIRKTHKAYNRVKENNFDLNGLLGFNLHGKTIGVVGAGKIGSAFLRIMSGFGCKLIYHDPQVNNIDIAQSVSLNTLYQQSDIISLHCPLTELTRYMINESSLDKMKPAVMIVNTSRGALIDTTACINGLKKRKIGNLALDVYEQESELFFKDLSLTIVDDDTFQQLLSFPNVLVTGHQGFFTEEAMQEIVLTTLNNIEQFQNSLSLENQIT